MASQSSCIKLADRIVSILARGVVMDEQTRSFITSILSDPDPTELGRILKDETNSDRDSLLDLIFTPDESVQRQLEPSLETEDFNSEDEKRITRRILEKTPPSGLIPPDADIRIELSLTPDIITAFVNRLNITQRLPAQLAAIINQHPDRDKVLTLKVRLRNSKLIFTPAIIAFLSIFFKTLLPSDRFYEYFNFVLPRLQSLPADQAVIPSLRLMREAYRRQLDQATRFDTMLKHNNMETLMLRGIRAPYISKTETRANIAIIDDLCYILEKEASIDHNPS